MMAHVGPVHVGQTPAGLATLRVTDLRNGVIAEATLADGECAAVGQHLVASLIYRNPDAPDLGALCDAFDLLGRLSKAVPA